MTKPQATFEDCDQPLKFTQKTSHDKRQEELSQIFYGLFIAICSLFLPSLNHPEKNLVCKNNKEREENAPERPTTKACALKSADKREKFATHALISQ